MNYFFKNIYDWVENISDPTKNLEMRLNKREEMCHVGAVKLCFGSGHPVLEFSHRLRIVYDTWSGQEEDLKEENGLSTKVSYTIGLQFSSDYNFCKSTYNEDFRHQEIFVWNSGGFGAKTCNQGLSWNLNLNNYQMCHSRDSNQVPQDLKVWISYVAGK